MALLNTTSVNSASENIKPSATKFGKLAASGGEIDVDDVLNPASVPINGGAVLRGRMQYLLLYL